jgi:hypothetical protein
MALASSAEHTKAIEKMFEAMDAGSSERFRAADETAKAADPLLTAIWDEYRHHRHEHGRQGPSVDLEPSRGGLWADASVGKRL